jgi:hypothetical protein
VFGHVLPAHQVRSDSASRLPERGIDRSHVTYWVGRETILAPQGDNGLRWFAAVFAAMPLASRTCCISRLTALSTSGAVAI